MPGTGGIFPLFLESCMRENKLIQDFLFNKIQDSEQYLVPDKIAAV
jgi:hypothetical protein